VAINANPTTITTGAKNGTLSYQTDDETVSGNAIADNEIIFDTDISTNNGDMTSTPAATLVGRLVIIRQGDADEETAYITAVTTAPGGGTRYCTVHQDWASPPVNGDTYNICYICYDIDDNVGNDFKPLLKRNTDWASAEVITIADGGFFGLLDGHSIETVDNSSTTVADHIVESGGRWDVGYLAGSTPVGGGYMIATPAVVGEFAIDIQSGGEANLHDFFLTCVYLNKGHFNGNVIWTKAKIYKSTYDFNITGDVNIYRNSTVEGTLNVNETLTCDDTTNIQSCAIVATHGLSGIDNSTTHTITLTNTEFVRNTYNIHVNSYKTWKLINPVWTINTGTQDELRFITETSNAVQEWYEFNTITSSADGSALTGVNVYVFEGLLNDDLVNSGITDSLAEYSDDIYYKEYLGSGTTELWINQRGNHAIRYYYYGKTPFVGAVDFSQPVNQPITLINDASVTGTSTENAIARGAGITVEKHAATGTVSDTNPLKVIHFDNGAGTLPSAGNYIEGVTSSASGHVVETIGTATNGTLVLENWNGTDFTDNEGIRTPHTSFTGLADTAGGGEAFQEEYTWLIDCNSFDLTRVYDYLAAKMAEYPLEDVFYSGVLWGRDEQSQFMYEGANGFYTDYVAQRGEGVWLANRGGGTIAYMTSDDGTTYIPPIEYTFTLTGLQSGSEVRIFNADTLEEIDGIESSSTSFNHSYTYTSDINIYVIIMKTDYNWIKLDGLTLSNSNQSIPVQQIYDRDYSNS
jgi:hypothetical protein